jgi:transposase
MSRPAKFETAVIETAQQRLRAARTMRELRAAQAILLPALFGLTRAQTAAAIGWSSSHVGGLQAAARKPDQPPKGAHGGRRRQTLTIAEEQQFLRPWGERAASAGMVIVPPLHAALEQQLGRKLHPSQVYRLLARHGWRKLAPDSVHPKADLGKQENWKKNSRKWWPKSWQALKLKENAQD